MKKVLVPIAGFAVAGGVAQAQLLDVDFSSDTTGIYTNGAGPSGSTVSNVNTGIGNYVMVVDGSSSPSNPFGAGKSLLIQKASSGIGTATTVRWDFDETANGVLTYDIFMDNTVSGFGNLNSIAYLYNSADTTLAIGIQTSESGRISFLGKTSEGGSNVTIDTGVNITSVGVSSFKIAFTDGKFSVWYGTTLLGDSSNPSQTEFWTRTGATSFDNVRFSMPSTANSNARYFLDNVMIVPEPSSLLLLVGALAGLLLRHCRR